MMQTLTAPPYRRHRLRLRSPQANLTYPDPKPSHVRARVAAHRIESRPFHRRDVLEHSSPPPRSTLLADAPSTTEALYLPLAALSRLAPLHKFLKEPLAIGRCAGSVAGSPICQELIELVTCPGNHRRPIPLQPLLGSFETRPAGKCRGQICFAPFGMAWRLLEFGELREEMVDESLDAAIAVASLRPIVGEEHRSDRDRIDLLAGWNHAGIVFLGQSRRQIIVLQLLREWNLQEPK